MTGRDRTVKEICLVCKGERWIPDLADPTLSRICPYCDHLGWVEIAPANFAETGPSPGDPGEAKLKTADKTKIQGA